MEALTRPQLVAAVPQLMGTTSKKKKSDKNENREDNGLASTPYATFEKDGVEFSNPVAGGLVAPLDLVKDGGSVAATNGKSRLSRDSTDSWDDNTLKAPLAVDAGVPPTPTSPEATPERLPRRTWALREYTPRPARSAGV